MGWNTEVRGSKSTLGVYGCCIWEDITEEKFSDLRRVVHASRAIVNRDTNLGPIQRTESWVGYGGGEAGDEARIRLYRALEASQRKVNSKSKVRVSLSETCVLRESPKVIGGLRNH